MQMPQYIKNDSSSNKPDTAGFYILIVFSSLIILLLLGTVLYTLCKSEMKKNRTVEMEEIKKARELGRRIGREMETERGLKKKLDFVF